MRRWIDTRLGTLTQLACGHRRASVVMPGFAGHRTYECNECASANFTLWLHGRLMLRRVSQQAVYEYAMREG
jgi:hypothetical protein